MGIKFGHFFYFFGGLLDKGLTILCLFCVVVCFWLGLVGVWGFEMVWVLYYWLVLFGGVGFVFLVFLVVVGFWFGGLVGVG